MGLSEELQQELDNMDARYAAVVRRLGEWQSLGVDLLECRHDESGMAECIHEAATMLREDVCPSLAQPSPSVALREAQELNARMRQEVADMDAQRAAAERRAMEVQEANDFLRAEKAEMEGRLDRMRQHMGHVVQAKVDLEERVRQVEIHGARPIGGVRNEAPAATIDQSGAALEEALRQASDAYAAEHVEHMAAQSIAEADVAPEPDQNHTETIPAPKKNRWSEEARAAASERMKAMQARKRAARESAAMPTPVADVVIVEEIAAPVAVPVNMAVEPIEADAVAEPAPSPGVFDGRTQACHARIVAEFAAGGHYTRLLEEELAVACVLTRHEVRAIADGVMSAREAAKVGKALKHCPECGGRFYVDKGNEETLCRKCRQIAAEVERDTASQAA